MKLLAGSKNSYLRRLPEMLKRDWVGFAPVDEGKGMYDVPCRLCPKYRRFPPRCSVAIGGRLRSCVCASIEYQFRDMRGKRVLEIGCGENPFAKTVVEHAGGQWIGVDPRSGKYGKSSVRAAGGEAQHLPFANEVFDTVMGVQTIEHWDRSTGAQSDAEYVVALSEVWRVLKPGGSVYFDAPIHLHGSAEFIRGDFDGIRKMFSSQPWTNLVLTTWRKHHALLRKKIAIKEERDRWPEILHHDEAALSELRGKSSYVVSIVAQKPRQP